MTHSLRYPDNEHQQSINNSLSCIFGNQSITQIFERITEPLTALIGRYRIYQRNNTDSEIIDIANCTTCKNKLLVVEYTLLIRRYYQSAKVGDLYESMDAPAGRSADNPPNSDGLGDFHQTVREMTVKVYWIPGPLIWQQFSLDPDPHPKWQSRTVPNTHCKCTFLLPAIYH